MKKTYVNAELEIVFLTTRDIITASGDSFEYDPNGILIDENLDVWNW